MRVSSPRSIAYVSFHMPSESPSLPGGASSAFQTELLKTCRTGDLLLVWARLPALARARSPSADTTHPTWQMTCRSRTLLNDPTSRRISNEQAAPGGLVAVVEPAQRLAAPPAFGPRPRFYCYYYYYYYYYYYFVFFEPRPRNPIHRSSPSGFRIQTPRSRAKKPSSARPADQR